MSNNISFLGLITKAGKTISGDESVLEAVRNGKAKLVLVASDSSDNTIKKYTDKCSYYKVDIKVISTKEELGKYTGTSMRAVVAVVDKKMANILKSKIEKDI